MSATQYLNGFVNAVNSRDTGAFYAMLTPAFYGYTAQGDEPIASEATASIAEALFEGFPDLALELSDISEADGEATATMTARGTFTGTLWQVPGDGQAHEFTATVIARPPSASRCTGRAPSSSQRYACWASCPSWKKLTCGPNTRPRCPRSSSS
ncbi:MAG: ester cyclase [Chloroflexi bacterium]|nr:ester cyclase [Chloroflexota bacterium]